MPPTRRVYLKNSVYEVVSRAREGLPLPPTATTNEILGGIYGRALRYGNVDLSNLVEMNNHHHIHAVPETPAALTIFYKELKKSCTEAVKGLLGLSQLNLWEPRSAVAVMPTLKDVMERLVYLFCNPAKAGLEDSIDIYPGLNSWQAFKTCEASVDATVSIPVRNYHRATIPRLPAGNCLSDEEDLRTVEYLRHCNDVFEHELVLKPLAWLKPFGITSPKRIEVIRQAVIKMVYEQEARHRAARTFPAIGAEALRRQEYGKAHTPAQKERKVFVFCHDPELRKKIITLVRSISAQCRACYEQLKQGLTVTWPQGVFIPWLPPKGFCSLSP